MSESETPTRNPLRAALRAAARASAPHPALAERAAEDFKKPLLPAVLAEIRWAFHPPRTWLSGVVANLFLAVAWLAVQPLSVHGPKMRHFSHHHLDWVVLVGTYFSSFILADVTTTNTLGGDHYRVLKGYVGRSAGVAGATDEKPGPARIGRVANLSGGGGANPVAGNACAPGLSRSPTSPYRSCPGWAWAMSSRCCIRSAPSR